ncbi:MAG: GGDEF domain-containing protein [Firmicutes bacterium]|nr:GGDEF domain-containing protein [Bacillota bacterium]
MIRLVQAAFVALLVAAGLAALVSSGFPERPALLAFLAAGLYLVERFHLRMPADLAYSLTVPVILAGAAVGGPAGALWLTVVDNAYRVQLNPKRTWLQRTFNVGQMLLCAALGSRVYEELAPALHTSTAAAAAAASYLVLNFALVTLMVRLSQDLPTFMQFLRSARDAVQLQALEVLGSVLLVTEAAAGNLPGLGAGLALIVMFGMITRRLSDAISETTRDPLTHTRNLRGFVTDFEEALEDHRRLGRPFGVIVLDLDRFKQLNDEYGHDVGNAVLTVVAQRIRHRVREGDRVYRIGGEEFAVLLPDVTQEALAERARQLDEAIRGEPVVLPDQPPLEISASVGWSRCPDDGVDYESLFRRADQAMYAVKQRQRR